MSYDLYPESQWYNAANNADIILLPKPDISYLSMKTLIEIHHEGGDRACPTDRLCAERDEDIVPFLEL
jgi:hypothetical protein